MDSGKYIIETEKNSVVVDMGVDGGAGTINEIKDNGVFEGLIGCVLLSNGRKFVEWENIFEQLFGKK